MLRDVSCGIPGAVMQQSRPRRLSAISTAVLRPTLIRHAISGRLRPRRGALHHARRRKCSSRAPSPSSRSHLGPPLPPGHSMHGLARERTWAVRAKPLCGATHDERPEGLSQRQPAWVRICSSDSSERRTSSSSARLPEHVDCLCIAHVGDTPIVSCAGLPHRATPRSAGRVERKRSWGV